MSVYKKYLTNVTNYDFINKFKFNSILDIPFLETVVLKFDLKIYDYDLLIRCLVVLELISGKKGFIIKSRKSSIVLKTKKGLPVGCKINLKNKKALNFLFFLINNEKLSIKSYKIVKNNKYSANFVIRSVLNLFKLQDNYHFFKNVSNLNIKIVTTTNNHKEFEYLLNNYKFKQT
jgi:large subunit ribosomal protein L5